MRLLYPALGAVLLCLATATASAQDYIRLQNRWKPQQYIHLQNSVTELSPIDMGWLSAHWQLHPFEEDGATYYHIQNRKEPGRYLLCLDGELRSKPAQATAPHAHWELTPVPGTNNLYWRLRNRQQPELFVHCEYGKVQLGAIDMDWWSAQWIIQVVTDEEG